jgi:subtilisin family serine protease
VIDDGFEVSHPEIDAADRVVAPLNVMAGTADPRPTPGADEWHGTSVLGLICASHNGRGACGVAPECRLIPIKLEALSDDEAEARAFDHAVEHGAAVINCSWGPYDDYSREPWPIPRIVSLAIDNAYRNDVCVVFAAGNGNEEIATDGYASHPHVIAVAASTDLNTRAYYSDFGEAVWLNLSSEQCVWDNGCRQRPKQHLSEDDGDQQDGWSHSPVLRCPMRWAPVPVPSLDPTTPKTSTTNVKR